MKCRRSEGNEKSEVMDDLQGEEKNLKINAGAVEEWQEDSGDGESVRFIGRAKRGELQGKFSKKWKSK